MAREIITEYGDKVTTDFAKNRELLESISDIKGKLVKNQTAGYMVRLKKRKVSR